jgi:diguanylate cyclase (GGDEF)-like protein
MLRSPGIYRIHAAITFFASLFPWLGMLAYQLGLSPYGLDVAPFGVALSGAIYGWGLFRFRLFDLSPVVHENVFEGMRDGVMVFDTKLRLIGVNPSMKSIFPEIDPERIGEEAGQLLKAHPEILALLADSAQGRGGPRSVDVQIGGGGRAGHYEADTSDMVDRRGRKLGVILTMTDISARIELLGRVNQLASMDPLTGARNRRSFLELAGREFDRAKRYGSPLAFVILDLDHFKSVNDTYGHQMGDKVLAAAAAACESQLRSSDLFCRFGGEEFLALLPGSLAEAAAYIAERLRSAVSELSFELPGGGVLKISASLGLSCRDTLKDESFDDLLGEADRALYRAKDSGRDRVVAFSE